MRSLSEMGGPAARTALTTALVVLLASGCTAGDKPAATPEPGTPLASYATEGLVIARADFCELIPAEAVERALGGPATSTAHYANGDSVELSPGVSDIAHEYNCTFSASSGAEARAWVFAPPISELRAARLIKQSQQSPGCTTQSGAAAYGQPTLALTCRVDGVTTASYRGLFIDTWLACSLASPLTEPEATTWDRAGRWCAAVAEAAHQRSAR